MLKSGRQYLRDNTVHLFVAWNRIQIEIKSMEISCEDAIKEKLNDIIIEFIEQNISDLTPENEEEDNEQFNEAELSSLTQRFDMMARL